ncbi:MAG TPA: hypothetical protein VK473_05680 [Terriglobales bacterium]|nr:hypothetical protein [Terriglobales bacterium]
MTMDREVKTLLLVLSLFLGVIALRPLLAPQPVQAQADSSSLYIEPGTTMLRSPDGSTQVMGKVVVDLKNGKVWGFPTLNNAPYPVDMTNPTPPVSKPIYLGRFDFAAMHK